MPTIRTRALERSRSLLAAFATTLLACALGPATAAALTITFDDFEHGEVVTQLGDVTVTADSYWRPFDYAVAFDTMATGTADPDLEDGWAGGNLAGEVLGRILILQENSAGCGTGVCSDPDDEGNRPAGTLTFDLGFGSAIFGFDLIDVDSTMAENGTLTLWDEQGESWSTDFMTLLAGFDIGDHTANRIQPLIADNLGLGPIVRAQFVMGGSGGIDNVELVPEPTTALLLGLGLIGLGRAGRRRS